MAPTVVAGSTPLDLNVRLAWDADFVWNITNNTGNWPDGDSLELRLAPSDDTDATQTVWPATITGPVAAWNVTNDPDVKAAIAAGVKYARLHYLAAAGGDLLWMSGRVNVD
jgi:hypothetical protein